MLAAGGGGSPLVAALPVGALAAAAVVCWPPGRAGRVRAARAVLTSGLRLGDQVRRTVPASPGQARGPVGLGVLDDAGLLAVVEAVVTQMRAGADPAVAWSVAGEIVAGADLAPGGPAASEAADTVTGRAVSAAWRLADRTGAPLADTLDGLCVGLRQQTEVAAAIDGELAAPRATARLLALLPLAGLAIGQLIGADPLQVLMSSLLGRCCAAAGAVLLVTGQLWMRWCVGRVEGLV
jgi:tight adherence protein B